MKIIKIYKDFEIEFIIPQEVEKYFKDENINMKKVFNDEYFWFEVILFDLIDDNSDGIPDYEIYGKKFEIVFYGIVEEFKNKKAVGFEIVHNTCENQLIEDDILMNIDSKFFAKYALIKKVV